MNAESSSTPLPPEFVAELQEAFISLSEGNFEVHLPRTGARDSQDTVAYLFNLMVEEVGELFAMRARHRQRMETLIATVTDVLVRIGSGEFEARVERTYDGTPEDVLAYLVNNAAEEVQSLFAEIRQKNSLLEEQASREAFAERSAYTTLSAGVGHELNNPLAYAAGNLEFVQSELEQLKDDHDLSRLPELEDAISDAREGVARAVRIAADLKALAPSVEMVFHYWDVSDVVQPALTLIRNSVVRRARLECRIDDLPKIRADRGRLGQVLVNLVQNAINAFGEDGEPGDNFIEIRAFRHSERMIAIEVRDNGEGISAENLSRIFDSFFTTRPVGQGTGLGLSLSKRMISDHGGRIEVESTLGQGSTFRLLIPVVREAAQEVSA